MILNRFKSTSLRQKIAVCLLLICLIFLALGCHSRGVDITIQNNARAAMKNLEVDYPGAAFGTGTIAPGASYWYHIKPLSTGEVTLSFEQENGKTFKQKGPTVHAGDAGQMILILDQDANQQWHMRAEKK